MSIINLACKFLSSLSISVFWCSISDLVDIILQYISNLCNWKQDYHQDILSKFMKFSSKLEFLQDIFNKNKSKDSILAWYCHIKIFESFLLNMLLFMDCIFNLAYIY